MQAGVHTFVEKPLSVRPAEEVQRLADELKSAQEKTGAILAVGYMLRYSPAVEVQHSPHEIKFARFNSWYAPLPCLCISSIANDFYPLTSWSREISSHLCVFWWLSLFWQTSFAKKAAGWVHHILTQNASSQTGGAHVQTFLTLSLLSHQRIFSSAYGAKAMLKENLRTFVLELLGHCLARTLPHVQLLWKVFL